MKSKTKSCRCHGISGTCTVKTCYDRMQTLQEVGGHLFEEYGRAVQVDSVTKLDSKEPDRVRDNTLVYIDNSPSFCIRNDTKGILGVAHRKCDSNSQKRNACADMCCSHGFYPETKIVPVEECEFIWCCRIECKIVRNDTVIEHRCRPPPPSGASGLTGSSSS